MVSIRLLGVPKVTKFLLAKNKEALMLANAAIKKAGFYIEGEVKQSIAGHRAEHVSVDTSFFINSILAIFPTPLTANIGCNKYPVSYAVNVEYSTKMKDGPRLHFAHTKTRNEKKVQEFIRAEIKKIG